MFVSFFGTVQENENGTCEAPPNPPLGSAANPARSCRDIPVDNPSGDYWIQTDDTSCPIRVYCELDGSACSCKCDTPGGWMRVANLDMTDPNQNCPDGFTQVNSNDPPLRLCGRSVVGAGCNTIVYPVNGIEYSRVCGRVIGYQFGTPGSFFVASAQGLNGHYVDGVSITYGSPRNHIWTFAASYGLVETSNGCPCDTDSFQGTVPSFIGRDYFCESGHTTQIIHDLFPNNPLWDGRDCLSESMCCMYNNPPYFCQTLDAPTTEDIEVRLCCNEEIEDEDTPLELIQIYVY